MTIEPRKVAVAILLATFVVGPAVAQEKPKGKQETKKVGADKSMEATGKAEKQAKDIFYRPEPPAPQQPAPLGLRYQILLRRGDYISFVPEGYQFHSGDQFRIVFQANADGYCYIFNRGTSGKGHVLFPDPRINGGRNRIPAHTDYVVPATGWFEFDRLPGTEELFVFFSHKPLHQLDHPTASPTIEWTVWQETIGVLIEQRTERVKSGDTKDIVYVEEGQTVVPQPTLPQPEQPPATPAPQPNYSPATYVATQSNNADELLIHTIKLNHN
ncbi:MAG: DUF4384 domain-containing protein [Phycisphaerae bacterium]|nr:DUF4384 domain-containing protein [Phycisphaerae bacterium]